MNNWSTNGQKLAIPEEIVSEMPPQRSELAQEIVSHKSSFMEKWALLIFLSILLVLLLLTWLIKYPDIIEATATLTATNAPKEIVIRQEGRLVKLFIKNNEKVKKGDVFGWIEGTADHREVLALSQQIDSAIHLMNDEKPDNIPFIFNRHYSNLGEVQQAYREFTTTLQVFSDYMFNGFYSKRKAMLKSDIVSLENSKQKLQSQLQLTQQDLTLAEESYDMHKQLFDEKVISKSDFTTEKSKLTNKQMAVPQLESSMISNEMLKREKQKEIDQVDHDFSQQEILFLQGLQTLKSVMDDWKKKFLLQSPVEGKIYFIIPLQENQFLQQGKLIGFINPDDNHFYAESNLPQNNLGKIDTGQKVQLRLAAYPYQEFGFLQGTLNYVSDVASDSGFLATVRLDNGLITNNKRSILYKNGLKAQAIFITRDTRLLQRLYYNMIKSTSVNSR